jgi:hypothetical protein
LAGVTIGRYKWMNTTWCLVWGCIFKTAADYSLSLVSPTGPHSKSFGMGLFFLSLFGTGWTGIALLVCVQLDCADEDIGMATLVLGAVRAIGGAVGITIYSTILNNALMKYALQYVENQVVPLGLSSAFIGPLTYLLVNEDYSAAQTLTGVTEPIYNAAKLGIEQAWQKGFHNMYLCSGSFAAASIIAAALTRDVSKNMTDHVAVRLLNEKSSVEKVGALEKGTVTETVSS